MNALNALLKASRTIPADSTRTITELFKVCWRELTGLFHEFPFVFPIEVASLAAGALALLRDGAEASGLLGPGSHNWQQARLQNKLLLL